jgi:hypothetical protein
MIHKVVFAGVLAAGLLTACGVGQIFGPGSPIPNDLQADANCVANQLLAGDLNPGAVAAACSMQMDQTFADLWAFLVDALGKNGKLSPADQAMARENMKAVRLK